MSKKSKATSKPRSKSKKKENPEFETMELKVDPYQGVARFAASVTKPGYVFYSMERKGTKAKITFIREDLVQRES